MNALAPHSSVESLVRTYEKAIADIRAAFAQIERADELLNNTFSSDPESHGWKSIAVRCRREGRVVDCLDDALIRIRRDCWRAIVDRLQLCRVMSVARWAQVERDLDREELPEITVESVNAFARQHGTLRAIEEMHVEAVTEVFDWLRPRGWTRTGELKTNDGVTVRKRVIVGYMVEAGFGHPYRVRYDQRQKLVALERVLRVLDGRGNIHDAAQSHLQTAIEASADGRGETELFRFRACGNGNLHLEFKREDLLKKLNEIAGGARLRPGTESAA